MCTTTSPTQESDIAVMLYIYIYITKEREREIEIGKGESYIMMIYTENMRHRVYAYNSVLIKITKKYAFMSRDKIQIETNNLGSKGPYIDSNVSHVVKIKFN